LLDAPMFTIRWRWNATRSLAVPRFRGGAKIAAPLQRMESENLLAAVFPTSLPVSNTSLETARFPTSAGEANDRRLPDRSDGH